MNGINGVVQTLQGPYKWLYRRFVFLTLRDGFFAVMVGWFAQLLFWFNPTLNPLLTMPRDWAKQITEELYGSSDIRLRWQYTRVDCELDDTPGLTVLLSNHLTTLLTVFPVYVASQKVSSRIVAVAKSSHLLNPMGWGLLSLGLGVFVWRFYELLNWSPRLQNWLRTLAMRMFSRSIKRLHQWAKRYNVPITLVIMLDPRCTANRHAEFTARMPELAAQMPFTLLPKSGAFLEICRALGTEQVRFMFASMASRNQNNGGWDDVEPLIDDHIAVSIQNVTEQVYALAVNGDLATVTEAAARSWLNTLWGWLNQDFIKPWRQ